MATQAEKPKNKMVDIVTTIFAFIFFLCLSALLLVGTWALCFAIVGMVTGC
jgi:hypothetical protein